MNGNAPTGPRRGRWLVVALLAAVAVGLSAELLNGQSNEPDSSEASTLQSGKVFAIADGESGRGVYLVDSRKGSMFAVGGQIASNKYGIYLVDVSTGTMALYEWEPRTRKLRWLASRNVTNDLKIDDYNTELKPKQVKELAEQSRRIGSDTNQR
ncbi:MAG: hypothetical protein ACOCWV_03400 [Planctomycetota bacterium]